MPSAPRPVAAAIAGSALVLAGCTGNDGAVRVEDPIPTGAEARTCADLVAALPQQLAGALRRDVAPADAPAAAWGDPPITLRCGTDRPEEFRPGSACVRTAGIDWFTPPAQYRDQEADATLTAMSHAPLVTVELPGDYRPEGAATVMSALAGPVKEHLDRSGTTCL